MEAGELLEAMKFMGFEPNCWEDLRDDALFIKTYHQKAVSRYPGLRIAIDKLVENPDEQMAQYAKKLIAIADYSVIVSILANKVYLGAMLFIKRGESFPDDKEKGAAHLSPAEAREKAILKAMKLGSILEMFADCAVFFASSSRAVKERPQARGLLPGQKGITEVAMVKNANMLSEKNIAVIAQKLFEMGINANDMTALMKKVTGSPPPMPDLIKKAFTKVNAENAKP